MKHSVYKYERTQNSDSTVEPHELTKPAYYSRKSASLLVRLSTKS